MTRVIRDRARLAGLFYLIFILCSIGAGSLAAFAGGDPARILSSASGDLFTVGVILNSGSALFFVLAAWALYVLLREVDENLALLLLILNAVGVAIQAIAAAELFDLRMLFADPIPAAEGAIEREGLLLVRSYFNTFMSAQVFFGAWLLPLGILVYRSGFLPRILGVLLIADCIAILLWFLQFFLLPGYPVLSYPLLLISLIAEFGLTIRLLLFPARGTD